MAGQIEAEPHRSAFPGVHRRPYSSRGFLLTHSVGRRFTPINADGTFQRYSAGEYFADLLVEDVLVVELKCAERLANEHTAQCLNYLRASGRTVCLLVNFQKPKVEWRRIVLGFPDQIPASKTQP
jgi:hypothetical protein